MSAFHQTLRTLVAPLLIAAVNAAGRRDPPYDKAGLRTDADQIRKEMEEPTWSPIVFIMIVSVFLVTVACFWKNRDIKEKKSSIAHRVDGLVLLPPEKIHHRISMMVDEADKPALVERLRAEAAMANNNANRLQVPNPYVQVEVEDEMLEDVEEPSLLSPVCEPALQVEEDDDANALEDIVKGEAEFRKENLAKVPIEA